MVYEVLLVAFIFLGINTGSSLSGISPQLSSPSCKKCPAGSFTLCSLNERSRCLKCVEGTYNDKPSRRGTCKPCTRCGYNEYESHPCNSTSNTVCVKCRECPPGFGVFRPCEKTRDTDCVKCPVSENLLSSSVKCGIKVDFVRNNIREKESLKDSFFVLREEANPWENGRKNPKPQHRFALVEKHVNANILVSVIPSVDPTPSSVFFFTKPTSAVDQGTILVSSAFNSSPSSSRSVEKSITFPAEEIIDPTLRPDIPSKRRPPSRPTEKSVSSFKTPTNFKIPGDGEYYLSREPRNIRPKKKDVTTTRIASPVSPPESVKAEYIIHGMDNENSTESYGHYTTRWRLVKWVGPGITISSRNGMKDDIPPATKESKVRSSQHEPSQAVSQHSLHWLWVIVALVFVVILVFWLRRHQKKTKGHSILCTRLNCRRPPRYLEFSDFFDGTSISSAAGAHTEQTESPTTSEYTQEDETEDSLPHLNNPAQHTLPPFHRTSHLDGTDTRSLEYITEKEATFDSSGGKLFAPDSDVVITVGSGAVQEGTKQRFFFRVPKDDSTLLQDIPDMPEGTLISPVVECGPHNVTLLKPVEITVPHDLCLDEVKKDSIRVYRCEPSSKEPLRWEKIPPASEKNYQSKAWFTVKKNSIHIKTRKFSIWSVFACDGTKRKRATVYFSRHNPRSDHIYLRFYIYSDNEDSKKRVKAQEKESFPDSRSSKEKPFKMYDDEKDLIVKLTDLEDGWELDKTPSEQTSRKIFVQNSESGTSSNGCEVAGVSITMPPEENEINESQETITSMADSLVVNQTESFSCDISSLGSDRQPATEDHFHCIREEIGAKWKDVLRKLELKESEIENICVDHMREPYGVKEAFYQGLLKWKNRFGEEATTKKLCDVLLEARCTEALKKFRELRV